MMEVWNKNVVYEDLNKSEKISFFAIRVFKQIYEVFYYHFLPYFGMYFSFYVAEQYWQMRKLNNKKVE